MPPTGLLPPTINRFAELWPVTARTVSAQLGLDTTACPQHDLVNQMA